MCSAWTPTFVYDFAHPTQGRFHIQMFREQVQRAADYLELHIRGRLVKARDYRTVRGYYTGRKIAAGFMVDRREEFARWTRNPYFCKYVRFDPWADVTLAIFSLFRENEGNLDETWHQLDAEGPGYPDVTADMIPEGFQWRSHLTRRSPITGQFVPSAFGLKYMLTNVAYIGHWVHKQVVVGWNNHEAMIPLDLFLYAYNRLSRTDFLGDPNPYYVPYRPWVRHDKSERQVEPPTYSYLVYTDDLPHHPHKQIATAWDVTKGMYKYLLADEPRRTNVWNAMARLVDGSVDRLVLERLKATTLDESAWQVALTSFGRDDRVEVRRIEAAIQAAQQAKENLVASLATLTNAEMVQRAQSRYEAANSEIAMLTAELEAVRAKSEHSLAAIQARPALEKVVANWDRVPRTEKRALFEGFATHIQMTKLSRICKRLTIHWRDGSTSSTTTTQETRNHFWEKEDIDKLGQMFTDNVDQVEIFVHFRPSDGRLSRNATAITSARTTAAQCITQANAPTPKEPAGPTPAKPNLANSGNWRRVVHHLNNQADPLVDDGPGNGFGAPEESEQDGAAKRNEGQALRDHQAQGHQLLDNPHPNRGRGVQ